MEKKPRAGRGAPTGSFIELAAAYLIDELSSRVRMNDPFVGRGHSMTSMPRKVVRMRQQAVSTFLDVLCFLEKFPPKGKTKKGSRIVAAMEPLLNDALAMASNCACSIEPKDRARCSHIQGRASRARRLVDVAPTDAWCAVFSWLETDEQIKARATCVGFRAAGRLSVVGPLSIDSMHRLSRLPKLVSAGRLACLSSMSFSNLDITSLNALVLGWSATAIQSLTLKRLDRLTNEAVGAACSTLGPRLQSINIRECEQISDDAIVTIAGSCPEMRQFRFKARAHRSHAITDASISALAAGAPKLVALDVDGCDGLTDRSLEAIATWCRQLHCLYLRRTCSGLTERGVTAVAEAVQLVECSLVSPTNFVSARVRGN